MINNHSYYLFLELVAGIKQSAAQNKADSQAP